MQIVTCRMQIIKLASPPFSQQLKLFTTAFSQQKKPHIVGSLGSELSILWNMCIYLYTAFQTLYVMEITFQLKYRPPEPKLYLTRGHSVLDPVKHMSCILLCILYKSKKCRDCLIKQESIKFVPGNKSNITNRRTTDEAHNIQ